MIDESIRSCSVYKQGHAGVKQTKWKNTQNHAFQYLVVISLSQKRKQQWTIIQKHVYQSIFIAFFCFNVAAPSKKIKFIMMACI